MRSLLGLAALVARQDGDADIVPFFVGFTMAAGIEAWAAQSPFEGRRRWTAGLIAGLWLVAAICIGALLLWYKAIGGDGPPPPPEDSYLGLTATIYHMVGVYGGAALVAISAFGPDAWFERSRDRPRMS